MSSEVGQEIILLATTPVDCWPSCSVARATLRACGNGPRVKGVVRAIETDADGKEKTAVIEQLAYVCMLPLSAGQPLEAIPSPPAPPLRRYH